LCEEDASPLRQTPQLARIAREKMQAAHLIPFRFVDGIIEACQRYIAAVDTTIVSIALP
jgi:hypothetical protein